MHTARSRKTVKAKGHINCKMRTLDSTRNSSCTYVPILIDMSHSSSSSTGSPVLLIAVQLSKSVLDTKADRFVVICETNHPWSLTQFDDLFEH